LGKILLTSRCQSKRFIHGFVFTPTLAHRTFFDGNIICEDASVSKTMIPPWALLYSIIFMASSDHKNRDMKLLHRIQALDASRRLDVVNKYIPALLVHENHASSENEKNIVVGHIHSNLVERIRTKLLEKGDSLPSTKSFLLPPADVVQKLSSSSSCVEESSTLNRNRFFGLLVGKTAEQDPSIALTNARSDAFKRFTDMLLECKIISKRHADMYPITDLRKPGGDVLATINRNAAPYLGITSVGVHLLCCVRDDRGDGNDSNSSGNNNVSLWLAQRAANKSHNALRWDPTVAGGQPASMGLFENVIKEAGEEAGIDPDLVKERAISTGCLSQMTCKPDGTCMKPSLYYTWDMQVDRETFVPRPTDGEVSAFELCSAEQLEYEVRHGDRLRPAMILVVTDFLIRQGVITPDNEPDYAQILSAMHRERLVLTYNA
jgi:isopentenyldiphosphate isomerase